MADQDYGRQQSIFTARASAVLNPVTPPLPPVVVVSAGPQEISVTAVSHSSQADQGASTNMYISVDTSHSVNTVISSEKQAISQLKVRNPITGSGS